ncbi:hypothetical protein BYT27DRAFT_7140109 [Phlegmacium glaucopus]|nr:hypothetical protein BYT27DRAFT_7140109 [Phlegmacium glaucopus]
MANISEAISLAQKAFQPTPVELINLGNLYLQRFQRTGSRTDLSEAISCQEKAVHLILEGDLDMPTQLNTLAKLYASRFECTGNLADLSEAVSSIQKCIQLTSEGDPKMAKWLDNLGGFYYSRFEKTGNLVDLSEAISSREKAIHLFPDGHPGIPVMFYNLGYSYDSLFQRTRHRNDLDKASFNYSMAATCSSEIPTFKLLAYKQLARISQELYPSQSFNAYSNAIQLVSQLAGLHTSIEMRYHNLRHISYVSTLAAACAFKLGRTDLALEWLEQSRGIVWGQLNDLRTPIGVLRATHPDLADAIVRVSSALQVSGSRSVEAAGLMKDSMAEGLMSQEGITIHVRLTQEWDGLLAKVRTLPNFEDFLQPLCSSTILEHLPKSGPIILINVHKDRCDALSLVPGENQPIHTPLPEFSYEKAVVLRNNLQAILRTSGIRMREVEPSSRGIRLGRRGGLTFKEILCQLWLLVVQPILKGLGYSDPPSEPKRIWWCATGPLAFLPIHAAGIYYGEPGAEAGSVLSDYAISSYTPTVRALFDRMTSRGVLDNKKSGLFMISQPDTPGLSPIPKTSEEVQMIQRLTEERISRIRCLEGAAATVDQTANEMEAYSSVHFACHASQNTDQPLKSGFALHDGRLELSSIIKKRMVGMDLAFLSACQTSTGDETLSEEAVHLAAGMLAAGYRGVVATMWSIKDSYAPEFAQDFYANVMEGSDSFSGENAARALHHATQNLRRKLAINKLDLESSLLIWVPYVHFGL